MYLERIVATKQREVEQLQTVLQKHEAERKIAQMPACRGFTSALAKRRKRRMGLIAEVKKASPSKGLIRPDFHPVRLAQAYERAGADCISILTDAPYFQGANAYLQNIREAVHVPLLRKDFIIDPLQIYEARLLGADAVLFIVAILSQQQLREYLQLAHDLGMDALVEVHSREELERVLELDSASLIGVNNRNLHTFEVDLDHTRQLMELMPKNVTTVSESGIASRQDIEWLTEIGAHAVLVGEHFMRQPDVEQAVIELLGPVSETSAGGHFG